LRVRDVLAMVGLSRTTLYALMRKGSFPKQVRLKGVRAARWQLSAVQEWIERAVQ
jgi:prophage regulatory protein